MNLRQTINQMICENQEMTINISRNPESAPFLGATYGQDVEPKGLYVLGHHVDFGGFINGKAQLTNPLFINVNEDNQIQYKRDLAQKYKAKGQKLTEKLMQLGHDAVVTVYDDGTYGEIVLFPNAKYIFDKNK